MLLLSTGFAHTFSTSRVPSGVWRRVSCSSDNELSKEMPRGSSVSEDSRDRPKPTFSADSDKELSNDMPNSSQDDIDDENDDNSGWAQAKLNYKKRQHNR